MDKLLEFASNHLLLILGIVAVVVAIVANEIYQFLLGRGSVEASTATQLYNREDAVFLDLRGENAYHTAHLPGAINIPQEHLDAQSDRLKRCQGHPVVVYGDSGRGFAGVIKRLRNQGLEPVYQLRGGIQAWQEANLPTDGRS
ncbi:MAG TPA: rhodanese-like domain-containing protein [Gammaproteobacteria bacterium]|nr:rhodanese-like domain-containing protein [Gammaproteobacteria bacterium]